MKRVWLLGGSGLLGTHLWRALLHSPELLGLSAPRSLELNLAQATDAQWDALLAAAQPDVIMNAAGRTSGTADQLGEANTTLVAQLLGAVQRAGRHPWLIHLGSAAEYGPPPTSAPVHEDDPENPMSEYSHSKLAGTRLIRQAIVAGEVRGVVLRVFNPVGAGQKADTLAGRAAEVLRQAVAGGQDEVNFGPLDAARDFVDARDVARAAILAAHLAGGPSVLNVASGRASSAREVVQTLARLAGFHGQITETRAASERSAAVSWQAADLGRLSALGWTPAYSLQEALSDVWRGFVPSDPLPVSVAAQQARI